MREYKVLFNNGFWEDTVTFFSTASSENEAVENVLKENPEYTSWYNIVLWK